MPGYSGRLCSQVSDSQIKDVEALRGGWLKLSVPDMRELSFVSSIAVFMKITTIALQNKAPWDRAPGCRGGEWLSRDQLRVQFLLEGNGNSLILRMVGPDSAVPSPLYPHVNRQGSCERSSLYNVIQWKRSLCFTVHLRVQRHTPLVFV